MVVFAKLLLDCSITGRRGFFAGHASVSAWCTRGVLSRPRKSGRSAHGDTSAASVAAHLEDYDMRFTIIVSAFAVALLSTPAWTQTIEYGKDRAGSDITHFNLPATSVPQNCQGACEANASCVAWTFVRSGWQGPTPVCWLKNAAPNPTDSVCCVSGKK